MTKQEIYETKEYNIQFLIIDIVVLVLAVLSFMVPTLLPLATFAIFGVLIWQSAFTINCIPYSEEIQTKEGIKPYWQIRDSALIRHQIQFVATNLLILFTAIFFVFPAGWVCSITTILLIVSIASTAVLE